MFGLNKDCTIITKDNKILKYNEYIYIQNSLSSFAGLCGFHKMPWTIVPNLVLSGTCWQLKNPN